MDLFSLLKTSWKFITAQKATTSKIVQAASLRVGLFPATKAGAIAGTWSKFYWSQGKDPYTSLCETIPGWVEEKLFSLQVIAQKFCQDKN